MSTRRIAAISLCCALLGAAPLGAQTGGFFAWPPGADTPFGIDAQGKIGSDLYNLTRLTFSSPGDPGAYVVGPSFVGDGTELLMDLFGPSDPLVIAFARGSDSPFGGIGSVPFAGVSRVVIPFAFYGEGLVTARVYLGGTLVGTVSDPGFLLPGLPYSMGSIAVGIGRSVTFDRIVLTSTAPLLGIAPIYDVTVRLLPEPNSVMLVASGVALLGGVAARRRRRG